MSNSILQLLHSHSTRDGYREGMLLYFGDKVSDFSVRSTPALIYLSAFVDEEAPRLSIQRFSGSIYRASCSCGYKSGAFCAHLCALCVAYSADKNSEAELCEDETADQLISGYDRALTPSEINTPASIVPVVTMEEGTPVASFKIGRERKYVIKGLLEFSARMREGLPVSYGEAFTFSHRTRDLDERSQRLCGMIRTYAEGLRFTLSGKREEIRSGFGDVRVMPLAGEDFDLVFDLYQGEKLPCGDGGSWTLSVSDPKLQMKVRAGTGSIALLSDPCVRMYHSGAYHYLFQNKTIYRISEGFTASVAPFLNNIPQNGLTVLSPRKTGQFCAEVLPYLQPHAEIENLTALSPYLPDELEVRYYIDLPERSRLTAQPNFTYSGAYVEPGSEASDYPFVRRNLPQEKKALRALEAFFDPPVPGDRFYSMTDEEKIYDFLTSGIGTLGNSGEVFVSDRLNRLASGKAPRPVVHAGVKGGMLELSLDTDEFPRDELTDLLRSVREKRRYYRLKDGRFLNLENGDFSVFAGTIDNLGINPDSMADSAVPVPLYKALFVDECLKHDSGIQLDRSPDYRKLLRDFKAYEDGDFPLPEHLEKILREYQKTGYQWLRTLDKYSFGGILADDMGLGKTLQVLAFLYSIRGEGPALIVCPASVLISWTNELERWAPTLRARIVTGSSAERSLMIAGAKDADVLVTSYDTLRNDIDFHAKNNYRVCVLDEAHYIKNRETKLFKCVKQITARTRLALSGTPVENRLSELWSLFDFLMPGYLGSYASFREKYETPITDRGDRSAQTTLNRLVHPFILRRMKKDVLSELPEKTEINCYVQMGEAQRRLYAAYAAEVKDCMESSTAADKLKILSMLTRLRQICCDPALCYEDYEDASCKSDECIRMLKELKDNGHKVLVFSQFTTMLDRLRKRLEEEQMTVFTLQGDTPLARRATLVQQFNEGSADVFLISLKAGGTGLNLTGADAVIHYDPWWNITAQNQATDRCYRIGQTRAVQVYKLIAPDTIEENIVRLQYKKLELANAVTENADGGLMHMSREELLELLK